MLAAAMGQTRRAVLRVVNTYRGGLYMTRSFQLRENHSRSDVVSRVEELQFQGGWAHPEP
jgi:hypothetical protein